MNKKFSIKSIVAIGIGAALFFVLARFAAIPTPIANTTIQVSYGFLALISVVFGPIVGGFVGFIGHMINDMTTYGPWWSWILCSGLCGFGYGLLGLRLKVNEGEFKGKDIVLFNIGQTIINAICWIGVAPALDILIYSEPASKVYLQAIATWLSNSICVAVIGTILLASYAKTRVKKGSLDKEA